MATSSVSVSCVPITRMKKGQAYVMNKLIRDIEFACRLIIQKSTQLGEVNFDHKGMWCFLLDNFKLMDNAFENLGLKGNASVREDGIDTAYISYSNFVPRIPQSGRINTRLLANTVAVTIMHDTVANLPNTVAKVAEEYRVSIARPGSCSLIPTQVAEFNCFVHPLATSFAENAGGAFTVAVDVFIASVEILVSFDVTQGKFNFEMDPTLPQLPAEMGTCMVKRKLNQKMIWEPMMWDRYKPFTCMVYNSHSETHEALIERVKQLC
ncbi:protein NAP1-like protein [Corchorus olitorius]|uniref:Protein NAP1-like protein n=1 Tax=Corchorus olitorius TaxID=93759 RepID=A0A1R3HN35_9ROSI|nr:protein NAP1-like protein [Corchorus olitorius]